MKLFSIALLLSAVAIAGCTPVVVKAKYQEPDRFATWTNDPPEYLLAPGDDLSVVLPYNPELNYEGPVGPDGRFTMPVVGTIRAGGRSVEQVEAGIDTALLHRGITATAGSSISVRHYADEVYVGGEVKLPGAVSLQNGMDPLQAITVAGGMLDTARTGEVVIIRHSPLQNKPMMRTVNIKNFIETGDPKEDVALQPLDIIYVPKSSIAEVDLWVDQYINKTIPFNRNFDYSISDTTTNPITTP
jgi:protein involved in polysaccharide export with SLBB domain